MKYVKLTIAALGCATAQTVLAQSSLTLYGVIDEGFAFVNNAQSMSNGVRTGSAQYSMVSAVRQGNRWGLRGEEDLGAGYRAVFVMESGFNLGTGAFLQGGTMFGRQAYVGIDTPYGTISLGRQYDSVVDFISPLTAPAGNGLYSVQGNDINNFGFTYRVNNAIKYTSKTFYGFTFGGLYSPGGVAGAFGRNSIYSFGGSYVSGPVTVAAALLKVRDPNRSFWGNNQNSSSTDNNLGKVCTTRFRSANPFRG